MRFPLEVAEAVRAVWPAGKPLFVRVSAVDGSRDGIDDRGHRRPSPASSRRSASTPSTCPAAASAAAGTTRWATATRCPTPARIRAEADIPTMAVGLVVDAQQAEAIVADGAADLVALAREAQDDPNFAVHAARELTGGSYETYPVQAGPRLGGRGPAAGPLGPWTGPDPVQVA